MEYYWIDDGARYTPNENKVNPWSVRYISSEHEGIRYFKTYLDSWRFIDETEIYKYVVPF